MADDVKELRDPAPLQTWLQVFVVLYMLCMVALGGLNAWFSLLGGSDPDYVPEDMTGSLVALGMVGAAVSSVIVFIVCIVLTARITYRMMRNLHQVGSGYVTIGPRWAVGWYFVPFANLVMPQKAVAEIWRGTHAEIGDGKEPNGAIGWWWAFWLGGNILDNVAARLQGTSALGQQTLVSADQLTAGLVVSGVALVCMLIASILFISLFRSLVRAQSQMVKVEALR